MDRETITRVLHLALDRLINEQSELLDLDLSERALTHHFARILAELIQGKYDVDVEYNRHGSDPKRLYLPRRKALDRELRATTVFPDVIVHRRNTDEFNLLVLEIKKPGESVDYDSLKLKAFRNELHYQHAAHVIIGRTSSGKIMKEISWVDT